MDINALFPPPPSHIAHVIKVLTSDKLSDPDPYSIFMNYAKNLPPERLQEDYDYHLPLYPDFDDYDYLHDTSPSMPIYLDDFDVNVEEDRQRLAELTRLEFKNNTFMPEPVCNPGCRKLKGHHYIGSPVVCPSCGNTVELSLDRQHEIALWIRCPEGVDSFVSHSFYNTFFSKITIFKPGAKRVIVARYMMDPGYRKEIKNSKAITELILLEIFAQLGIEQDEININGFFRHCDRLMEYLIMGAGNVYTGLKDKTADAWEFWTRYKSKAFHTHLKVPSRYSTILEKSDYGTYGVEGQLETKNMYYSIAGCKKSTEHYSLTHRDLSRNANIVGRKLIELSEIYSTKINQKMIFHKKALSRKHVCSGNLPVTGRRVITSMTGLLNLNEIMLPWRLSISMFTVHLQNFLYREGYTPNNALRHLNITAYKMDDRISEHFRMIEESRQLICKTHRNPSNEFGSLKSFFGQINRDLTDDSLRISILACAAFNSDFDGDQMPVRIPLDNESKAKAYGSFGHHQTLDKNIPFRVGPFTAQPSTHMMNLNMMMLAIKDELEEESKGYVN